MSNSNSYLTLRLDDASFRVLRTLSKRIAAQPAKWLSGSRYSSDNAGPGAADEAATEERARSSSVGDKEKEIAFDTQDDLHITFVFFGEALAAASKEAIQGIYEAVRKSVSVAPPAVLSEEASSSAVESRFAAPEKGQQAWSVSMTEELTVDEAENALCSETECHQDSIRHEQDVRPGWAPSAQPEPRASSMPLRLRSCELFPPEKQNLIIGELEFLRRSDEEHVRRLFVEVHRSLKTHSVTVRGAPSAELLAKRDEDTHDVWDASACWRPHVTLGKIRATKQQVVRINLTRLNRALFGARATARTPPISQTAGGTRTDDGVRVVAKAVDVEESITKWDADAETRAQIELKEFPLLRAIGFGMGGIAPKRHWCDWDELCFNP